MPKSTASGKKCDTKSLLSSRLTRDPIHKESEDEEEDVAEEKDYPKSSRNLYPSEAIKDDLEEIKGQPVQINSRRRLKKHPPSHGEKSEEEAKKSSNFCSPKYIIIFLVGSIALLLKFYIFPPEKPAADRTADLTEFISGMKNKFEGQSIQTFLVLKSSLKHVFNENSKPTAPSVITIITNRGAEITASDFSIYIAQELAYEHYVSINESVFHRNPDDLKYVIDNKIKSKFDNRSLNVAVVDKLHNVPIDAAMIFHNYCDHENALFKRAIFLFIVHLSKEIPENSSLKFIDNVAMDAMRRIWRDASDDVVDSLITRLTATVINIK